MRYIVLRDCHFANRYWKEGEIAEFPDSLSPNRHFDLMKKQEGELRKPIVEVPEEETMSGINEARKKNQPRTGMAYVPPAAEEKKELVTAEPQQKKSSRQRKV